MRLEDLHRFIAAEQEGREAAAEDALGAVFAALPEIVPRPGFADRVLRGAGLLDAPAPAPWSLPARLAAAAALVSAGLTTALLMPFLLAGLQRLTLGEMTTAAVELVAGAAGRVDEAFALWRLAAGLGEALWTAATSPPVALALLSLAAVAALAYRGLSSLLSVPPRSAGYA